MYSVPFYAQIVSNYKTAGGHYTYPILVEAAYMKLTVQSDICNIAHVTIRIMCLAVTTHSPPGSPETRRKELLSIDCGQLKDCVSFIVWNLRNRRCNLFVLYLDMLDIIRN